MQQVLPGIHTYSRLVVGRVYLVGTAGGLALINAGLPELHRQTGVAAIAPATARLPAFATRVEA